MHRSPPRPAPSARAPRAGTVRAAVALVLLALAPLLLIGLASALPSDAGCGPTIEASSAALGGVQRLVAAHGPRPEPVVAPPPACRAGTDAPEAADDAGPPVVRAVSPDADAAAPAAAATSRRL